MKLLELYAGIGGVAEAARGLDVEIVAAIEHDEAASKVYQANFPHRFLRKNLVSVKTEVLEGLGAQCWWMSPPCQPYTVRGKRLDVEDRRSESFLRLLTQIPVIKPRWLLIENVPGFSGSVAHARLRVALQGYEVTEHQLCLSDFGYPVKRPRFYLVAGRFSPPPLPTKRTTLAELIEPKASEELFVSEALNERFGAAFHTVKANNSDVAACFTSAYGNSPVYAGSYLKHNGRVRRFSAQEICTLHGFRGDFSLTDAAEPKRTKLAGNSLAIPVVRWLLEGLY